MDGSLAIAGPPGKGAATVDASPLSVLLGIRQSVTDIAAGAHQADST